MNADFRVWKPNVAPAAIIERDDRFLFVEEQTGRGALYNLTAWPLGPDAPPVAGVIRASLKLMTYCN